MSGFIVAGAVVSIAGSVISSEGAKDSAKRLREDLAPSNAAQLQLLQARVNAAERLEQMADKLESGEPISPAEQNFLDSVVRQADLDIEKTRGETLTSTLGTAAGTGFLRAGRTQDASRKLNVEAESSRNKARILREQDALDRGFRRTVELPAQLRQGILSGATAQGGTFLPQVSGKTGTGGALQALGSGLIGFGGEQQASENQTNALQKLLAQIGTGQGGTTSGGTSVQGLSREQQNRQFLDTFGSQNR